MGGIFKAVINLLATFRLPIRKHGKTAFTGYQITRRDVKQNQFKPS